MCLKFLFLPRQFKLTLGGYELNEAVFQVLVNQWNGLDKHNYEVHKPKSRKKKLVYVKIVSFARVYCKRY